MVVVDGRVEGEVVVKGKGGDDERVCGGDDDRRESQRNGMIWKGRAHLLERGPRPGQFRAGANYGQVLREFEKYS